MPRHFGSAIIGEGFAERCGDSLEGAFEGAAGGFGVECVHAGKHDEAAGAFDQRPDGRAACRFAGGLIPKLNDFNQCAARPIAQREKQPSPSTTMAAGKEVCFTPSCPASLLACRRETHLPFQT